MQDQIEPVSVVKNEQNNLSLANISQQPEPPKLVKVEGLTAQTENKDEYNFSHLNPSQQKAILDFVKLKQGLQLLQGPPGTGKTTTIVELIRILCQQKKRILVCAPSNKAVQVIAERFYQKNPNIPMALAGVEEKLAESLRDIFIHTWGNYISNKINLIFKRIQHLKSLGAGVDLMQTRLMLAGAWLDYQAVLAKIKYAAPQFYQDKIKFFQNARSKYLEEVQSSKNEQKLNIYLNMILDIIVELYRDIYKADETNQLELILLNHAQVIFATQCVTGRDAMKGMNEVDVLIVDEAAQTVEAETVITFHHQPQKCLLVGDPKQLPALVLSEHAKTNNYSWSMMERLMEINSFPFNTLTTQYRMHPAIRQWPSNQYYSGKLEDGDNIKSREVPTLPNTLMPYAFIDINTPEKKENHTYCNPGEANTIVQILKYLRDYHKIDVTKRVGIITGYTGQVSLIRKNLKSNGLANVLVNTVDGYQGDECDFIIISFVRSNRYGNIGFLEDARRLNVAVTRAKISLIMLGNKNTLSKINSDLQAMVIDAEKRQCIFSEQELLAELRKPIEANKKPSKPNNPPTAPSQLQELPKKNKKRSKKRSTQYIEVKQDLAQSSSNTTVEPVKAYKGTLFNHFPADNQQKNNGTDIPRQGYSKK